MERLWSGVGGFEDGGAGTADSHPSQQRAQIIALLTLVNSARATVCVRFSSTSFFFGGGRGAGESWIDMRLQESKHSIIKHKRAFVKGDDGPSLSGRSFCLSNFSTCK